MSKLKIRDIKGKSVGDFNLDDSLLISDKGDQAVHDVTVAYLARQRAGTASTLRKGEVAGSNRKPWRQKGTGRARAGYRQSPIWRGGAVAFGPHPRSYSTKVNKKVSQLAFRRAFSDKLAAGAVNIVDDITISEVKTKLLVSLLKSFKIKGPALLVLDRIDRNVVLSARNIPDVEVARAGDVNVYQLLRYPAIVVTKAGMKNLEGRLKREAAGVDA